MWTMRLKKLRMRSGTLFTALAALAVFVVFVGAKATVVLVETTFVAIVVLVDAGVFDEP